MQRPEQSSAKGNSIIPLLLAFIILSAVVAVLSLLTLGFVGFVLAMALALSAFIGLQYLLWGWWLTPLIHKSQAADEPERNSEGDVSE